jgi:hypothetical protein
MGATASDDVAITVNTATAVTKNISVNIYSATNAYTNSAWNNWSIKTKSANNITSTAFKYSDGTASTVSATLSNSSGIADNGATYGSGMAPAPVLRYTSYYTGNRTLTIKGLSLSKTYNVELYASRNVSGSSTIFTINGVSQTIATYNNLTNKALFTNLSANSSGQLVINIAKTGSFNCINGFSVTESSSTTSTTAARTQQVVHELETLSHENHFEIYPNPASDKLLLKCNNTCSGKMTLQITAASGQVVKSVHYLKEQPVSQYVVPISDLVKGIYFIRIQVGSCVVLKKFAKL